MGLRGKMVRPLSAKQAAKALEQFLKSSSAFSFTPALMLKLKHLQHALQVIAENEETKLKDDPLPSGLSEWHLQDKFLISAANMTDPKDDINNVLNKKIFSNYDELFSGVLLAYGEYNLPPTMPITFIKAAMVSTVALNALIFSPACGAVLRGGVNDVAADHLSVLVLGVFNATIPFKEIKAEFLGQVKKIGMGVQFEVTSIKKAFPIIIYGTMKTDKCKIFEKGVLGEIEEDESETKKNPFEKKKVKLTKFDSDSETESKSKPSEKISEVPSSDSEEYGETEDVDKIEKRRTKKLLQEDESMLQTKKELEESTKDAGDADEDESSEESSSESSSSEESSSSSSEESSSSDSDDDESDDKKDVKTDVKDDSVKIKVEKEEIKKESAVPKKNVTVKKENVKKEKNEKQQKAKKRTSAESSSEEEETDTQSHKKKKTAKK